MKVSSTKLPLPKLATTAIVGVGSAVASKGLAQVTDSLVLSSVSSFSAAQTPLHHSSLTLLGGLGQNAGAIAASAGLTAGLGLAAGAIFGKQQISLDDKPLWKRILFNGPVGSFNQGLEFRESARKAQALGQSSERFQAGAKAGWKVGSKLGGTIGSIQGGLTGAHLGWQYSGDALQFVNTTLESTPLPKPLKALLPLAVGASCIVLGQMAGSAVGGLVGRTAGGSLGGLGVGAYAALHQR